MLYTLSYFTFILILPLPYFAFVLFCLCLNFLLSYCSFILLHLYLLHLAPLGIDFLSVDELIGTQAHVVLLARFQFGDCDGGLGCGQFFCFLFSAISFSIAQAKILVNLQEQRRQPTAEILSYLPCFHFDSAGMFLRLRIIIDSHQDYIPSVLLLPSDNSFPLVWRLVFSFVKSMKKGLQTSPFPATIQSCSIALRCKATGQLYKNGQLCFALRRSRTDHVQNMLHSVTSRLGTES